MKAALVFTQGTSTVSFGAAQVQPQTLKGTLLREPGVVHDRVSMQRIDQPGDRST
jgi:hypothetical protein